MINCEHVIVQRVVSVPKIVEIMQFRDCMQFRDFPRNDCAGNVSEECVRV